MTMKSTLRSLAAGALALGSSILPATAAQTKFPELAPTLDEMMVVENGARPITQSLFRYNQHAVMVETTGARNSYALNLENKNARLLLVDRESETGSTDAYRLLGGLQTEKFWADLSYNSFAISNRQDSVNARLVLKPTEILGKKVEQQLSVNDLGTWRAMTFLQTTDSSRLGVAVGQNEGIERVAEVTYSAQVSKNYSINGHVKVGDRAKVNCRDARLRFGRNTSGANGVYSRGIEDDFGNSTEVGEPGVWKDPTQAWSIGQFNRRLGAEAMCGNQTGDIGGDIKLARNGASYAAIAINVGDYGVARDVMIAPQVMRDFSNNKDSFRMGLSTYLGKAKAFRVWTQTTFTENTKPDFAGFFAYNHSFGGAK